MAAWAALRPFFYACGGAASAGATALLIWAATFLYPTKSERAWQAEQVQCDLKAFQQYSNSTLSANLAKLDAPDPNWRDKMMANQQRFLGFSIDFQKEGLTLQNRIDHNRKARLINAGLTGAGAIVLVLGALLSFLIARFYFDPTRKSARASAV